ncbi:SDR family oxidoreductase [Chamaesiphon minutus]|uniref:Nucleoside-diphosphate-sugar epimerase n=1 Tax=Chamaesiphon minutus (strain ATCC 27169 / PCC 6605) TaxID=1173020 RepID=K9UHP8_CHAP6|nr:SDR family oxidoreductase [Chamaesiphon minutus]AFY93729.1 nucleoside-diphosphate-sugar epimerase [Chamaesiphon minutus PCC 6605]
MYDSIDKNNPFGESSSALDMGLLTKLISQQTQNRLLFGNMAILGCGYVGSAVADYWQDRGHDVTGTTTSRERIAALSEIVSKVVLMKGDNLTAVQSLLEGRDTLLVSVAPTGAQVASEAAYADTYINTTKILVDALDQAPNVKQIIYLSSCSVYGDRQGAWVDETTHIDPLEHNGHVLHQAEQIILQAANQHQKVCVLRLGGIYGPDRELVSMFGGMAGMTMPGKGDRVINWIHRDDIVGAIEFARLNELEGIYNLVDDSQLTVKEQVKRVCTAYGLPQVQWDASKLSLQRKSLQVSNQKIKAAGYDFIHPQLLV